MENLELQEIIEMYQQANEERWFTNGDGLVGAVENSDELRNLFIMEFLEEDEEIEYVVTDKKNEDEFVIIHREELLKLIFTGLLEITYIDFYDEEVDAKWGNKPVRIEYL